MVIDKKLFSKVVKSRKGRMADKQLLPKIDAEFEQKAAVLRDRHVDKLFYLVNGKTSQGIKDYLGTELVAKGAKFTQKVLFEIDYMNVQLDKWTTDKSKNDLIRATIINYQRKYKELDSYNFV